MCLRQHFLKRAYNFKSNWKKISGGGPLGERGADRVEWLWLGPPDMGLCVSRVEVSSFSLPWALTPTQTLYDTSVVKPHNECVGGGLLDWDPQRQLEGYVCVWQRPPETIRKCVCVHAKWWACVITTVVVVTEGDPTQKISAHADLTYDPQRLVAPIRSLPPSCQPFFLHLSSTSIPSFPLWGSSLSPMEVWSSSWLSAKKGSGVGKSVDEGKREGSIEDRKIDLILFMSFL